ncbi:flagellar biosynthesis protein FlhF [Salirhabdus euzebyi]|uniref:Flagellar biosynthesis protein FlhF n=1 Tax=Salirhabdus euzebyi TaxID=394506 RepID=A0A841Q3D3_9BACI|nr:flagellar biosynthesis protein FlhF [Salirhabdus euzebyi]MBB6452906.1 flagellar biosynthesis protein FlhF [Salirhabdus euzebyi]
MKVKKYKAPTMPEAMNQIRKELGSDAVILNSKVVKSKGLFGFFQKNNIEVIAAIDPHLPKERKEKQKEVTASHPQVKEIKIPVPAGTDANHELLNEIKRLRNSIENQNYTVSNSYPETIQKVYDYLLEQEVKVPFAKQICERLLEKYYRFEKQVDTLLIKEWLKEELEKELTPFSYGKQETIKKVIHFVGPTGVGKTTTIAKIAAEAIMDENKKVALITMDTYRIGAIDQLKTYGKILNIPMEVAYNYEDFVEAKKKFKDFDVILVDTAGRNYKQIEFINQLSKNIDFQTDDEMYLVLSSTTRYKELKEIFHQFTKFPIKQIILTKIDETTEFGSIVNLAKECQVGIAYMTNGQNVPDDLIEGSIDKIVNLLIGGWNHD